MEGRRILRDQLSQKEKLLRERIVEKLKIEIREVNNQTKEESRGGVGGRRREREYLGRKEKERPKRPIALIPEPTTSRYISPPTKEKSRGLIPSSW